ncbi:MAG: hypothetical protein NC201_06720 [Prevotella sp.]|nr:hypothetical protein [Bacteroides sp.]MCM1366920.1 hypothetical protein [Prevotella sp.]
MKLKSILLGVFITSAALCSAQQIDPVTKAMLDGNTEWIQSHPNDYEAYFERAGIYLQLHRLDEAYLDIVKAIENTPSKERDAQMRNFSLLTDILIAQDNLPKAVEAINKALEIDPANYANIYKKGNIYLNLKMPDEAYSTFASMQRLKSRSQEAFFGMAKAKALKGEMDEARDLIKEVEQSDPTNYITYCRIGDFYNSIGLDSDAANNYLFAFALTDNSSTPMNKLLLLGQKNYTAVSQAIQSAAAKAKNNLSLDFLLAEIAYRAGAFNDAYNAYASLLATPDGNDSDLLAGMARTCLALNKIPEAQTASASALNLDPSPSNHILRSKIQRAAKLPSDALAAAKKAYELNPGNIDAVIEIAIDHLSLNNYNDAIYVLNEAIMSNADNPLPLLLRGYAYQIGLKDEKRANSDFSRAAIAPIEEFPDIAYCALAKTLSGKKIDGDAMIERAITKNSGKDAAYWTAVYFAQTGNLDKAREWKNKALSLGYGNIYNLDVNQDANINLSPIR